MSEQIQFRPGPHVIKSKDFSLDVDGPPVFCGDEDHGITYEPLPDAQPEWYRLFYEVMGLDYGPPSPYARELINLEIMPVLSAPGQYPTYIGMRGLFLDDRPQTLESIGQVRMVSVTTLLQIDAHGGYSDHFSFAVVGDGEIDDIPEHEWHAMNPTLSKDVATMMSRMFTHVKRHSRKTYGG